jgi:hypothetical protein
MSAKAMKPSTVAPILFDWNALTEAAAFVELSRRLGVTLTVKPDGGLSASGNTETVRLYLADIAARHRGRIIAYLLQLPPPMIETDEQVRQEQENILATAQALDVTIADYCRAARHPDEYRERLLEVRRRMAPALLVQNLCAFRWWLFEVREGNHG